MIVEKDNRGERGYSTTWLVAGMVTTILLAILFVNGRHAAASPAQDTIVRCDPKTIAGSLGQTVTVDIYVQNVAELYGADVRLGFDTTKVQVVDADAAATGVQIEPLDTFLSPDFVVRKVADNDAGTIWYAATQVNPSVEVTGSGPLARIILQPLQPGTFELPITYQKLVKRTGIQIPAIAQNCSVTFIEVTSDLTTYLPMIVKQP